MELIFLIQILVLRQGNVEFRWRYDACVSSSARNEIGTLLWHLRMSNNELAKLFHRGDEMFLKGKRVKSFEDISFSS